MIPQVGSTKHGGFSNKANLYIGTRYLECMTKISTKIATTCEDIKTLLLEKNAKYGNSAVEPISIFSKQDNAAAICARIDDKLSRIKNVGLNDATEDTLDDLIGYLILLKIARDEPNRAQTTINLDLQGAIC